jgi:Transposase DDE domain
MPESITLVSLMLHALKQVPVQESFDPDPYESRRTALKGERLLHVLVAYQMVRQPGLRGLLRAIEEHAPLQAALGGPVARNTLANALTHRPLGQMVEAWMRVSRHYGAGVERLGKKFARIALVDSSLLKLSLAVYDWAEYQQGSGAAKLHAVLEWQRRIPQQLVVTAGKVHDANRALQMQWQAGWTYVQDRGYVSFARLAQLRACGAHFVVRLKRGLHWRVVARRPVPLGPHGGVYLRGDQTIRLAGWPEVEVRLVSYQLPDYRWVWVLTDRFDLTASSIARLYKERWKIENWWKWLKTMLKIKRPLGEGANALPLQLIAAFVTDLLWRVFKAFGHFSASLYEFVTRCQELSLVRLADITDGALRRALARIRYYLSHPPPLSRPLVCS